MQVPSVSVVLRYRRLDGTRAHCAAATTPNGRLKAQYGIVNGKPTHLPGSIYYLRYREGEKRVWERVGTDPGLALTTKLQREHLLKGASLGLDAPGMRLVRAIQPRRVAAPAKDRLALCPTIHAHCRMISLLRNDKTAHAYERDLMTFADGCAKQYVDELTRADVQTYIMQESARGMSPKTISNRLVTLKAFLRKHGQDGKIVDKADQPRIHKKLPHVYSREQVKGLLTFSSAEDRLVWEVFLAAGLREQELSHLGWEDVNFERGWLHLHAKPEFGFTLKDAEERQIPLPKGLLAQLQARKEKYPKSRLVFPTAEGKPEGHLLRRLKETAFAAGLNCGRCVNRAGVPCKGKPVCRQWQLHSFRRTAATRWHEAGLSVPTVQRLLGHSDVETTMSYLVGKDFGSPEFRAGIEGAFERMAA